MTGAALRRTLTIVAVLAALVGAAASQPSTAIGLGPDAGWQAATRTVAVGVDHTELRRGGADPAVVNVARVAPGADVELRAVLAYGTVGQQGDGTDRETTSSICGRTGGVVCVNGDFATCYSCGQPFGGVVDDGRVLRSFHPGHEQVSMVDGRLAAEPPAWSGRLVATYGWPDATGRPDVTRELPIDGLNVEPVADGAVLYTPEWGAVTPIVGGGHLRLATDAPIAEGANAVTPIGLERDAPTVVIGGDAVVSADGARSAELAQLWDEWNRTDATEKRLVVETSLAVPVSMSVGGHPELLRRGERLPLDETDPLVRERHPRTLVGWNDAGEMLLVTVDGRQPGRSVGMTLSEATDLLLALGATDGMNLDGGGSTTFVAACPTGLCVANRPSGGAERPVSVAVALLAKPIPAAPAAPAAAPPPPPPPPAPPAPPEPTPTSMVAPADEVAPDAAQDPSPPVEEPPAPEAVAPVEVPATTSTTAPDVDALRRELAAAMTPAPRGRPAPGEPVSSPEVPLFAVLVASVLVGVSSVVSVRRLRRRRYSRAGR